MQDPFAPESNKQLFREAQVGLLLVAALLSVFVYVAYYRITGQGRQLPDHVLQAPVAQAVWPNSEPPTQQTSVTQFPPVLPQSAPVRPTVQAPHRKVHTDSQVAKVKFEQSETINVAPIRKTAPTWPRVTRSAPRLTEAAKTNVKPQQFQPLKPVRRPKQATANVNSLRLTAPVSDFQPRPKTSTNSAKPTNTPKIGPKIEPKPLVAAESFSRPAADTGSLSDFVPSSMPQLKIKPQAFQPVPKSLRPDKLTVDAVMPAVAVGAPKAKAPAGVRPIVQPMRPILKRDLSSRPLRAEPERPSEPQVDIARVEIGRQKTKPAAKLALGLKNKLQPSQNVQADRADPDVKPNHVSQPNESFWSIATEHYGDGRYFRALYQYNEPRVPNFDHLPVGTSIAIPPQRDLKNLWPDLCPSDKTGPVDHELVSYDETLEQRLYITRPGDTLFEIAGQKLGQASRYLEILSLNDLRLPTEVQHLSPLPGGLKLMLPKQ